jgi:hypothetical protein
VSVFLAFRESSTVWADPEIEFVVHGGLYSVRAKGLAEMAASVREVFAEMEDWHDVAEECREVDANRVLVLSRFTRRGRSSGVNLMGTPQRAARVFAIHEGKVTRMHAYWDRDRALADLGLRE